uniref:Uncharacterized protein n=1 Tax=Bracon brevicornis TaxID=1563983 RepID=A0A6V7HXH0_9HYME
MLQNNQQQSVNNSTGQQHQQQQQQQYSSRSVVQFDLEAAAFPPLPGLDADNKNHNSTSDTSASNDSIQQSQNRLSDVVKGTAKLKITPTIKDNLQANQHNQQNAMNSSRSTSPGTSGGINSSLDCNNTTAPAAVTIAPGGATTSTISSDNSTSDAALSTVTLTPPTSPDM